MATTIPAIPAHLEDGMLKTIFVPENGISDYMHPTAAELNAETVLELSPYMPATGFNMDHSQETVDDDRESSAAVGSIPASDTYSNTSLQIINNVNTADAETSNEAFDTLKRGVKGFIVRRRGKTVEEPFADGDVVTVLIVTIGLVTPVAHAQNARQMSTVNFSVDPKSQDETVTVAAGV